MEELRVLAYAKLNLVLRVVGRRDDGYHLLETLMTAIDLADELLLSPARALKLEAPGELGPPEENLALKAAQALKEVAGTRAGARIRLVKRIPPGAGLGGGSSDAAGVLAGLNELWGLRLSERKLAEIGATLGADVPFFLSESPAWAEGVGEKLTPADVPLPAAFLILVPPFPCPTPAVYRLYDELNIPPSSPARFEDRLPGWENDLWPAAVRLRPELGRLRAQLETLDSLGVGMTGAGSALFCAFASRDQAGKAAQSLKNAVEGRLVVAAPVPRGYKFTA